MLKTDKGRQFRLSVMAMALAGFSLGAQAAGLGRLTVTSALGQPLRAEIELTASRDELASLSARLASVEAFKNAGIDFTSSLSTIRFSLDKRPNGQPYILASSDRPLNEPFVDMLVEVNWASGRLVREYTFLLDPPAEVMKKAEAPAPVAVPEVRKDLAATPVAPPPAVEAARPAPVPAPAPEPRAAAPEPRPAAPSRTQPAAPPVGKLPAAGLVRQVAKGETLGKIASEVKPAGVNLDQMLAALFLSNKEAFDGGNMNRLRAGKILRVPDNEALEAVKPDEARRMVIAQAADFNAYRKKLAAATAAAEPAREEAPKQQAAGKITPKVEEKTPAPAGKDKLEVSRTEAGKGGKSGERIGALEEDLIARDKALKEAQGRIAALEKNLNELKKLAEMKAGAGTKPEQAPAKPAEPPKPAPAIAVPAQPVVPPKPAEPPKEAAPPAPKPVEVPPPAPSFMDEHPEIVLGGGAIVALLLGYLGYNARRRRQQAAADAEHPSIAASSVFGTAGGQTVDTGAAPPTDFSEQPGFDAADEGVDPVAEADVYIAYGRDTQAEEILLEALKTDPTRTAIHVKLLEIYAARKDLSSFESVARELYGLTGGTGSDWERAQLLGRSIDPTNPFYGGSAEAAEAAEPLDMTGTVVMEAQAPVAEEASAAPVEETPPEEEVPAALDFDLDLGAAPSAPAEEAVPPAPDAGLDFDLGSAPEAAPVTEEAAPEAASLDFELDMPATEPEGAVEPSAEVQAPADEVVPPASEANGLDFDFDLSEPATEAAAAPEPAAEEASALQMPALDMPIAPEPEPPVAPEAAAIEEEFELPASAPEPEAPAPAAELELEPPMAEPEPAAPVMPPLDLAGIDLELDQLPADEGQATIDEPGPAAPQPAPIIDDPEVATKLELAQAYEEMGDKEGARELLNEVINEGSPAQQDAARQKLAALA